MTDTPIKKKKAKGAGGRPSKYKPEYCEDIVEYFSIDPVAERVESTRYDKDGNVSGETLKETGPILPTFTRYALKIGVCDDTLLNWSKEFPEFLVAYRRCEKLQEDVWRINALKGTYNAAFSIFLGKNVFGYKDKTEIEQNTTVTVMPTIKLANNQSLLLDVGDDPDMIGESDE